ADSAGLPRWLRPTVWCVAVASSFLQAWANRFFISPDGNNYLDIASNYLRHDWANAINGWWSPMFSWLLAGVLYAGKVPGRWESTAIHFVNAAALLVSLGCFEFFLRALRRERVTGEGGSTPLAFWLLGYALFFSTSFFVLTINITTPDVWVAALTYLAT